MKLEELYARLLRLARQYNRTSSSSEELAAMFWLEFQDGEYEKVRLGFRNDDPFMRAFVKRRCLREWTKEVRRNAKEIRGEIVDWLESSYLSPAEETIQRDQKRKVAAVLVKLDTIQDPRERMTAVMLMAGANRRQIQRKVGCSLGTVQNLIARLARREPIKELYRIVRG